jgi:hypothetical protein
MPSPTVVWPHAVLPPPGSGGVRAAYGLAYGVSVQVRPEWRLARHYERLVDVRVVVLDAG